MYEYHVGERVRVRELIVSKYMGHVGVVREVIPHKTGKETLLRCQVEFPDGSVDVFWTIELEPVSKGGRPRTLDG